MTQPIQEPSTPRSISKLTWGENQLFRRPAPISGGSGWGVPDLILSGGADQIPGDAIYPIPWADYATPHTSGGPTAPFNIDDSDGTLFTLTITDDGSPNPGNDRYVVTSTREGWWASQMVTQWDQVGTAGDYDIASVFQIMDWTSTTGIAFSPTEWRSSADWMINGAIGGSIDSFGFGDDSYLVTTMLPHYLPANKEWRARARHRTGIAVDRGLSGVMWKFWFIAFDDLDAWTFGNVFD